MITFVEVPEEKQFPSTGCGTSHMSKEVNTGVPEYSIKTQHHLGQGQQINKSEQIIIFFFLYKHTMVSGGQ